ncbi:MAG TPA: RHS repeat protein [Ignavibacteria bacterium]|nr:RHS repeat protein [Ignavibacteria bacterium]HMQ99288.1 RHS repeat protein [Ignavibacteria bacterium]
MIKIPVLAVILLIAANTVAQDQYNINSRNNESNFIHSHNVKSKSVYEYRYSKEQDGVLADSGYKSFYYGYDDRGNMTEYSKFHVFTDLTIKEFYQYGKGDRIIQANRYNSKNDIIEMISYRYNKKGQLKSELHEAYYNSVRVGVYFTILASVMESELFGRVQDELAIEPRLESYTIIVNITDPEEQNQYIVIGDETDPSSPRYWWSQLSMATQKELLAYQGPNRKEHEYVSKFINEVKFSYDKAGNLTKREVYNTSGSTIEKESFKYDPAGRRIAYTKYNEDGRVTSMESYSYDGTGRLIESAGVEPGGSITGRLSISYDEYGNIKEKIWYNRFGEINGKYVYIYEGNRLKEEIKYRGETEKESHNTYGYDEHGKLIDIVKYDINDRKDRLIKYVYESY